MNVMNRTIRDITDHLCELLPEDQQYYKLDNLRSWGFPAFIVERIKVELERNLAESMRLPETDWANMQSKVVQNTWQRFISAIREEAWLPASYAKSVIETAVADVLEMLIQPRQSIPEIVFGADNKLTKSQVVERVHALVVYRHFARLLPLYMEKKGMERLTKEKCSEIIAKTDEKVTARYTPLNWAQMLEPLFILLKEKVDSSLIRMFFEDKHMEHKAKKFAHLDESVNRAQLIEMLSSPESILKGDDDDESEPETEHAEKPRENIDAFQRGFPNDDESSMKEECDSSDGTEEAVSVPLSHTSRESRAEFQHQENSLNTFFADEDKEDPDRDVYSETEEENYSINHGFEENEEEQQRKGADADFDDDTSVDPERKENDAEADGQEFTAKEDPHEESFESGKEEKAETPMWQRFMSSEELRDFEEEETFISAESDFIEEPLFGTATEDQLGEAEISKLKNRLSDEREYFVEKIFRGSEEAFEEALAKIAAKKEWRGASRYIEEEIFRRNLVDMYSEEAIDFTDRLHSYFNERSGL